MHYSSEGRGRPPLVQQRFARIWLSNHQIDRGEAEDDANEQGTDAGLIAPQHSAAYWAEVTAGFDFSEADQVPPEQFNRVLWAGLMGNKPYPVVRGQSSSTKGGDN